MDSEQLKTFVSFLIKRKIINVAKSAIENLEDLKKDQYNISDSVFQRHRAKILNCANDGIREIEDAIKIMDISFNKNKR